MRTGAGGEERAARYFVEQGYTVVARNHRCPRGEVDLVVEKGALLVFVEVRTRTAATHGLPQETVRTAKQAKVVRAARDWLARNRVRDRELRFDVVGVLGEAVTHLPGAFDAGGEFTL